MIDTLIFTIDDINNYGNRLQNSALRAVLATMGRTPTTLRQLYRTSTQMQYLLKLYTYSVRQWYKASSSRRNHWALMKRFQRSRDFSLKHCDNRACSVSFAKGISRIPFSPQNVVENPLVVIGSDQVWNYRWLSRQDLALRLGLISPNYELITYAASIGLNDIDDEWRPLFREGWSRIPYISVREDRAAELVKEISGRDAAVVLDPTLMLTREQWAEVFTDFVSEDDVYVLTYFLGHPSDEQEKIISSVAKGLGARIRRLNDIRDLETYVAGPAEFVELFSKAQYVFTDSYHACCFSILYNKPFKVFNRAGFDGAVSMNSRMKTLFRLFGLGCSMGDDALPSYDWRHVNALLEQHRRESRGWLENALGVDLGVTKRA